MIRAAVALVATLLLAACATSAPQTAWKPRSDAKLSTDQAACVAEANAANLKSMDAYSNATFGAAAAAAGHLDRDYRPGTADRVYMAVRDSCMERKGWVRAQ